MNLKDIAPSVIKAAYDAGQIILKYYANPGAYDHKTTIKDDGSPVTAADIAANNLIVERLAALTPTIPIVTEESSYPDVKPGEDFWLVDPLDGTKQYVDRTGEFTVNIALIRDRRPVLGAIYVPTHDRMFIGYDGVASTGRTKTTNEIIKGRTVPPIGLSAIYGRREKVEKELAFALPAPIYSQHYLASSLKFCLVAQGRYDVYIRRDPSYEWDTAAGQAIVEAAGGRVVNADGQPLEYQKPDWLNPGFVVMGKK
ncbi:MAG: 3'(2'),5'-bisphosphate nucleotidase CysQ [Alphaproteobacteria bacterium]